MFHNRNFFLICSLIFLGGCLKTSESQSFNLKYLEDKKPLIPLAIMGSGPAGLMAAIYGARAHYPTYVFQGTLPGGLLTQTTIVENWPGDVSIMGPKIIDNLKEQAEHLNVNFIDETIESVSFDEWPYKLTTEAGNTYYALSLIVATGALPRKLSVPGEEEYWGAGVTSCAVCDGSFFKGREVVVVGGGDSAVEEATYLANIGIKKVTVLVRKDTMRAAPSMQEKLKQYKNITITYNTEITEILGDKTQVTGVELRDTKTGDISTMKTDGVFLAIGHIPNTQIFKNKLVLDDEGYIQVQGRTQKTSVPGVYTAGDVQDRVYRQAGVASGDGIKAGLEVSEFLSNIHITHELLEKYKENMPQVPAEKGDQEKTALHSIESLDELNQFSDKLVILDFYTESCSSCIHLLPYVQEKAAQTEDMVFAKVNAEDAPEIINTYQVRKVPTFIALKDGKEIAREMNVSTSAELDTFITDICRV